MKVYIDSDFKCHTINLNNIFNEYENSFFNGKCDTFIEGYRFIPTGETWVRSDGKIFSGEMITPWKPYSELDAAQRKYEQQLLQEYKTEKEELNASYNEGINSI